MQTIATQKSFYNYRARPVSWHACLLPHHRSLEIEKNLALRKHNGTYEAQLTLSSSAKGELSWWIENVNEALIQFHIKILFLNLELILQKRGGACIWMVTLPKAYGPFRKASCTSMS